MKIKIYEDDLIDLLWDSVLLKKLENSGIAKWEVYDKTIQNCKALDLKYQFDEFITNDIPLAYVTFYKIPEHKLLKLLHDSHILQALIYKGVRN